MTLEQKARVSIATLRQQAGRHVCDVEKVNIHATYGVDLCEFPFNARFWFPDYKLYIHCKAAGLIEGKKGGASLTSTEARFAPLGIRPARHLASLAWTLALQLLIHRHRDVLHLEAGSYAAPCLRFIGPRHWWPSEEDAPR